MNRVVRIREIGGRSDSSDAALRSTTGPSMVGQGATTSRRARRTWLHFFPWRASLGVRRFATGRRGGLMRFAGGTRDFYRGAFGCRP